jgi:toxin ParE1/3/4
MAFNISFHPLAELELAEAVSWYEEQQNNLGFSFFEDYLLVRNNLQENPLLFPIVFSSIHRANFKKFPFSVFFEIIGNEVLIYSIFHQKRKPTSWFDRLN